MKNRLSLNVERAGARRKPRAHTETSFHIAAFRFMRTILPKEAVIVHVPNGGKREGKDGAILKAMGLLAGFPDCLILWSRRAFCLEFKTQEGELSIEQRDTRAALETAGIPIETCRTFEEIVERLEEFGIPLRRAVRFGDNFRDARAA